MFFKWTKDGWNCMHCASSLSSLPLHPRAVRDQVIWRGQWCSLEMQGINYPATKHHMPKNQNHKPVYVSTWLIITKYWLSVCWFCQTLWLWLDHVHVLLYKVCLHIQALIRCLTYSSAASSSFFSVTRNWTAMRKQGVRWRFFSILWSSYNTAAMLLGKYWTQWGFPNWIFTTSMDSKINDPVLIKHSLFSTQIIRGTEVNLGSSLKS
jgi:hypothetical protein